MKSIIAIVLALFSSTAAAQVTVLVCEGRKASVIRELNGPHRTNITLTKVAGKVVKAVYAGSAFTTKKVATKDSEGLTYRQLIVEANRIILRVEWTENNILSASDNIIEDTGAYAFTNGLVNFKGQCSVRAKAF